MTLLDIRTIERIDRQFREMERTIKSFHSDPNHCSGAAPNIWEPTLELIQYAVHKDAKKEHFNEKEGECTLSVWVTDDTCITLYRVAEKFLPPTEAAPLPTCSYCGSVVCMMTDPRDCLTSQGRTAANAAAATQSVRTPAHPTAVEDIDDDIPF